MKKRLVVLGLVVLSLFAGCGINDRFNESRGRGDSPTGQVDDEPKDIIQFPDRFANISHACDGHGHRVFVTTRDAGLQMEVVEDESCD